MSLPTKVKYCPITGNQPLTCTLNGFQKACKKFQANVKKGLGRKFDYCLICQGDIPDAVTFIDLSKFQKERVMATNSKKTAKCQSCGEVKNVFKHFGKDVCTGCSMMRKVVKNNPEQVFAALKEFGKMPEAIADSSSDAQQGQINILSKKVRELQEEIKEFGSAAYHLHCQVANALGYDAADKFDIAAEVNILKQKLENATTSPEHCELEMFSEKISDSYISKLNELAWKLADGVMAGTITGIEVDDIRTIRLSAVTT